MDCLQAQAIISEALDRSPVDTDVLEAAKAHCRECADCGRFVRALAVVHRAPAPEPPADLADRVMSALVIDVARKRAEALNAPEQARDENAPLPADAPLNVEALRMRMRDPRARRQLVIWASAAAVVFVAAGMFAVTGVRQILVPSISEQGGLTYGGQDAATTEQRATDDPFAGSPPVAESAPGAGAESTAIVSVAPDYVVLNGYVYRNSGPSAGIDPAALETLGTVSSALATGKAPTSRTALGNRSDLSRIHVEADESDTYLTFDRVTRSYEGGAYSLRSKDIAAFGEWPTLPSEIAAPLREDGSPTFTPLTDSVYRLATGGPEQGIAIPPNSPSSDPAAGNPNWTWWAPLQ